MRKQAERFGARCVFGEVVSADFSRRPLALRLSDEQVLEAEAVVIATGASAQYLGLESERQLMGRGVSACATCDGAFFRGQPVAVVGGGDTAMEEAMFLSRLCSKVTLIHRREEFRASSIMAARVAANPKIEVLRSRIVDEVLDVSRKRVTGLRLRDVKTGALAALDVAGLFVAIGHKPNTDPFKGQIALDERGFILTSGTKTSVDGVFAAGDVQDHVYRQAVTAAGSGCMAALDVARYLEQKGQ